MIEAQCERQRSHIGSNMQDLADKVIEGDVLMHGCSLDNLATILADGVLRCGLRKHAGPAGVSLTTSIDIARQYCRTHEDEFNEVLHSWYDVAAEADRHGVVLVFSRTSLSDLAIIPFNDFTDYDEQEERVLGDIDNVFDRLLAIVVDEAEVSWFEAVVDVTFRASGEPADDLLRVMDVARSKFVHTKAPVDRTFR